MMATLISPHYVPEQVTQDDLAIASLAFGFTLGFGWLTTWTATKQTLKIYKRNGLRVYKSAYVWMIWLEIAVCLIFAIICWLYLKNIILPSFAFYFCILTTWALQVHFLLQIIINRCAILLTSPTTVFRIKVGVAILITAVNISVYNIWIPARLQISERYILINEWWDRIEKAIYLIVDASLNYYFIRLVQRNLVWNGLTKYQSLIRFNMFIVCFSLSMDVLIICMMSLKNTFVYMQFHPLAYVVKLNIEMSMADLIGKVAKQRRGGIISNGTFCDFDVAEDEVISQTFSSRYGTRAPGGGVEGASSSENGTMVTELQDWKNGKFVQSGQEVKHRTVHLSEPSSPSILQCGPSTHEERSKNNMSPRHRRTSTCSAAPKNCEQGKFWWGDDKSSETSE